MTDHRGDVSSKGLDTDLKSYVKRNPGPYIGRIKSTADPLRMGRLGVNIIAKTGTLTPKFEQLTWASYLSPFYGAKSREGISTTSAYDPQSNGHSYGMWFVPPDIDTDVLVIYVEGNQKEENAFWLGCVQQPVMNHMIPGHAANDQAMEPPPPPSSTTTEDLYGTKQVPAGEINRKIWKDAQPGVVGTGYYPVNDKLADQLKTQGLIKDPIRGTTTSSAQREAPSQVFGINTPGRIRADSRTIPIEIDTNSAFIETPVDRDPGHSFVMDDGDETGENQLTRIRTASGHQLLMHDTEGVVYIANASGNAWIEMTRDGRIDIYAGAGGINLRTDGDFNLHSETNINFHAKRSINFSSQQDVVVNAERYSSTIGQQGIFVNSANGKVMTHGANGISSYTPAQQTHGASGQFHLQGSQVRFNDPMGPPGAGTSHWGPTWLTPNAMGIMDFAAGDVDITVKEGTQLLEANSTTTKTTVHRFVTHEPMQRLRGFPSEGIQPYDF
jgi:hypothetical protein